MRKTAQSKGRSRPKTIVLLALLFAYPVVVHLSVISGGSSPSLVYLPPVLINLALFILFARTLLSGRTPLVTRFALVVREPMDRALARYTRRLTAAWAAFFAVMTLESGSLALFAPVEIWSLFTNFLNYSFILVFFIVEYHVRLRCLAGHSHPSFLSFCRMLVKTDLRSLAS